MTAQRSHPRMRALFMALAASPTLVLAMLDGIQPDGALFHLTGTAPTLRFGKNAAPCEFHLEQALAPDEAGSIASTCELMVNGSAVARELRRLHEENSDLRSRLEDMERHVEQILKMIPPPQSPSPSMPGASPVPQVNTYTSLPTESGLIARWDSSNTSFVRDGTWEPISGTASCGPSGLCPERCGPLRCFPGEPQVVLQGYSYNGVTDLAEGEMQNGLPTIHVPADRRLRPSGSTSASGAYTAYSSFTVVLVFSWVTRQSYPAVFGDSSIDCSDMGGGGADDAVFRSSGSSVLGVASATNICAADGRPRVLGFSKTGNPQGFSSVQDVVMSESVKLLDGHGGAYCPGGYSGDAAKQSQFGADCTMMEIILYDRALSTQEMSELVSFLKNKWAID